MLIFCFIITIAAKKPQVTKTGYLLLSLVPLLAILLVLTNDHHHLMWRHVWLDLSGRAPALAYVRGEVFWGYIGFSHLLIFTATFVLIRGLVSAKEIVRKQLLMMLGLIPLARELLIESMGDPVIALDMNDRILDLNRAAQDLFRIDRAAA